MVNAHTAAARIIANIVIWGILLYGLFFLVAFKDHAMGWEMFVLSLGSYKISCLGLWQYV